LFLLFPGAAQVSTLLTGATPAASRAAALAALPKLNDDTDAANQLVLFLALGCNLHKFNQVQSGNLSREAMIDVDLDYIDMRLLLKPYGIEADASLGVE
jgi:hypothetical protein